MLAGTIWRVIGEAWSKADHGQAAPGGRRKVRSEQLLTDMGVRI